MAKAQFTSFVSTIHVAICPNIDGCVALPKDQGEGWRGVVEQVVEDMNEPGVTCQNAMEMSISCGFDVELQDEETPTEAHKRVRKSFIKSWNKIVKEVEKGIKLRD